jgi:perosamine synthetase
MAVMEKRTIYISQPVLGDEEWEACREPLHSGWVTQGPKVKAFEEEFAKIHGVKHAFAVTSCTTGLHLALAALNIGPGDDVLIPAFTWVSTANAVLYVGANPVFVDVDPKTNNIDIEDLKRKATPNTKAVIPVHLFGLCADIDAIKEALPEAKIVEDAACAAGAQYKGKYAGNLGDVASFSFHPRKSITTGEGGMVTCNDDALAERIDKLRNHGAEISEEQRHNGPAPYILPDFNMMGFNFRMTDLQGAVGLVQIKKLFTFIDERQKWADFYIKELADVEWLNTIELNADYKHGWQSFCTYVDETKSPYSRNEIMEKLQDMGISTRPGTHAVHMLNFYKNTYGIHEDDFPGAKACNNQTMAIPLHNRMVEEDYKYIVNAIKSL